jgi:isopentenyldiphosphate isomerase
MSELLDYYDDNMNLLGHEDRDVVHAKGLWHRTFHCWVLQDDGNLPRVLFQRRGPEKKAYPNTLDITAAGHLAAGEAPEDGVREFQEELGIAVEVHDMHFLGIRVAASLSGGGINREFNYVFLLRSMLPLGAYKLQYEEVTGLVGMPVNEGLELFDHERKQVRVDGFEIDPGGQRRSVSYQATLDDIIPRKDNYYLKVFIMAQRLIEGRRPICI